MKRRAEVIRANPRVLPKSTLGKAVRYLLNEYTALVGYLRDGRFEIDSNLVENDVQTFSGWKTSLALYWASAGRLAQRRHLHHHPKLPPVCNQSTGVSCGRAPAPALHDQQPGPGTSP